jgi:hypothetical protein
MQPKAIEQIKAERTSPKGWMSKQWKMKYYEFFSEVTSILLL